MIVKLKLSPFLIIVHLKSPSNKSLPLTLLFRIEQSFLEKSFLFLHPSILGSFASIRPGSLKILDRESLPSHLLLRDSLRSRVPRFWCRNLSVETLRSCQSRQFLLDQRQIFGVVVSSVDILNFSSTPRRVNLSSLYSCNFSEQI